MRGIARTIGQFVKLFLLGAALYVLFALLSCSKYAYTPGAMCEKVFAGRIYER